VTEEWVGRRWTVRGSVGPQAQIRLFWLLFALTFAMLAFVLNGEFYLGGILVLTITFIVGIFVRRTARRVWSVTAEEDGLSIQFFAPMFLWYTDLEEVLRHGDDVTFKLRNGVPINIFPGIVMRRRYLKLKIGDAETLVDGLNQRLAMTPGQSSTVGVVNL
jgi:hypothetical protein